MHMADALISPAVGGTMWAVTAGLISYSAKRVKEEKDEAKIPLMGVLGAFIFAAQMINFSIPATGSSGHLAGGTILAILLGPYAAFLVMASVLIVQALFFADGGLLALGCNIFNMGFFPCFLAYPLIYQKIVNNRPTAKKILIASLISSIVSLQLGAFSVVIETVISGISELPFKVFVLLMQPIHLAIGIVEGLVTAAIVLFVARLRPELVGIKDNLISVTQVNIKKVLISLILATIMTAGLISWFASTKPDGLEWAIFKTSGKEELKPKDDAHDFFAKIQEKIAFFPDYAFKTNKSEHSEQEVEVRTTSWPSIDAGTSVSGLVGGAMTFFLVFLIALGLKFRQNKIKS